MGPVIRLCSALVPVLLQGAVLFASAGRLDVASFWCCLSVVAAAAVTAVHVVEPGLWQERRRPAGKRLALGYHLLFASEVAQWVVAGLDRGRFHWLPAVAPPLALAALAIMVLAAALNLWSLHANRFLSPVVRIQTERGHRLVTDGPYAWIRHPFYLSGLIVLLVNGLALGSYAAVPWAWLYLPVIVARTIREDRFLKESLSGYADYARKVKYRLIPGVW